MHDDQQRWGAWLLDQDEMWISADGDRIPLADMTPAHRRNVTRWLLVHDTLMRHDWETYEDLHPGAGTAAWLEAMPLLRRLRDLEPGAMRQADIVAEVGALGDAWRCCDVHARTWAKHVGGRFPPAWASQVKRAPAPGPVRPESLMLIDFGPQNETGWIVFPPATWRTRESWPPLTAHTDRGIRALLGWNDHLGAHIALSVDDVEEWTHRLAGVALRRVFAHEGYEIYALITADGTELLRPFQTVSNEPWSRRALNDGQAIVHLTDRLGVPGAEWTIKERVTIAQGPAWFLRIGQEER